MIDNIINWLVASILLGTVFMYGAMGEMITQKSGHLNLGVPGIMMIGAAAGYIMAVIYEKGTNAPNAFLLVLLPLIACFVCSALAGLLYSFFTVTLKANQNVCGLALTSFGVGLGLFLTEYVVKKKGFTVVRVAETSKLYLKNINAEAGGLGKLGSLFLSYGFMVYLAVVLAVLLCLFLKRTRVGLNLRAVGENPQTADAAGINVPLYRTLFTSLGAGICGLGGLTYVMCSMNGMLSPSNPIEAFGWLAVALVIFGTWNPVNAIWGSYLFAFFYRMDTYLGPIVNHTFKPAQASMIQAVPYAVTIIVLIVLSVRKKRENQPPANLGLNYFREDR